MTKHLTRRMEELRVEVIALNEKAHRAEGTELAKLEEKVRRAEAKLMHLRTVNRRVTYTGGYKEVL